MLKKAVFVLINRALVPFRVELVRRAEIEPLRDTFDRFPSSSQLPEDSKVAEEIAKRRSRLEQLRSDYAKCGFQHSVWSKDLLEHDVPFDRFRADSAYVWQQRDGNREINYVVDMYYLRPRDRLGLLDRLTEDGRFGAATVEIEGRLVSRDLLDSVSELLFLDRTIGLEGRELSVLDIGAGYGRLAHRAVTAFPKLSYFCTDAIPESSFLCEYYLDVRGVSSRAVVAPLHELDAFLESNRIDLAVNVQSFSECTLASICRWLDLVAQHRVAHLFIVPGRAPGQEDELLSRETDRTRKPYTPELEKRGYRLKIREPKHAEPRILPYGASPVDYHLFELVS
jgi:putative sugar O-methyltransferase